MAGEDMENKTKIGIVVGVAFIIVAMVFGIYLLTGSQTDMFIVLSIVNAVLIALVAIFIIYGIRQSKKSGQPVKDEMTRKITHKAGYYSWLISMYTIIGIMVINIFAEETGSYYIHVDRALPILVIFPGLAYILLMLRYQSKGDA